MLSGAELVAKFLVRGADAERELQRISAADVAVEPGQAVYTQWLNERGGIEADLTVTRLADDAYMVVTAAATANAVIPMTGAATVKD